MIQFGKTGVAEAQRLQPALGLKIKRQWRLVKAYERRHRRRIFWFNVRVVISERDRMCSGDQFRRAIHTLPMLVPVYRAGDEQSSTVIHVLQQRLPGVFGESL